MAGGVFVGWGREVGRRRRPEDVQYPPLFAFSVLFHRNKCIGVNRGGACRWFSKLARLHRGDAVD